MLGPALAGAEPAVESVGDIALQRNVAYSTASKSCLLDIAWPQQPAAQPRPVVLVIHGGGWLEGDKSSFVTLEDRMPGNILDFAARGFVSVGLNYRLSRERPIRRRWTIAARRSNGSGSTPQHIISIRRRIGAYGNSAGGHLALLLAMTDSPGGDPPRVQAAVSDSGPLDLLYGHEQNQLRQVIEMFIGGPPSGDRLQAYRNASPVKHVAGKLPPLLLIYGGQDEQVDVRTADDFVAALSRAGDTDVSYIRLADAGHCPHSLVRVPYLRAVVEDFFVRVLKH